MTLYAQQTGYVLGATPLDVPLGKNLESLWVNIANNTILGQASGATCSVLENGAAPSTDIGYGLSKSFQLGSVSWVRFQGAGANITFMVSDSEEVIASTLIAQLSAGGASQQNIAGTLGATDTVNLYTVPPNYKAHILRIWMGGDSGQQFNVQIVNGANFLENIGPAVGKNTMASSGRWQAAFTSGSDIILSGDEILLQGDILQVINGPGTALDYNAELLVEPL